jgi:hypothetical protein
LFAQVRISANHFGHADLDGVMIKGNDWTRKAVWREEKRRRKSIRSGNLHAAAVRAVSGKRGNRAKQVIDAAALYQMIVDECQQVAVGLKPFWRPLIEPICEGKHSH